MTRTYKFYVAGRRGQDEPEVQNLIAELRRRGHTITYDWPANRNHLTLEAMRRGAAEADILVLLWDQDLIAGLTEVGMVSGGNLVFDRKVLYVVGQNRRQSIFQTITEVRMVESTDQILQDLRLRNLPAPLR